MGHAGVLVRPRHVVVIRFSCFICASHLPSFVVCLTSGGFCPDLSMSASSLVTWPLKYLRALTGAKRSRTARCPTHASPDQHLPIALASSIQDRSAAGGLQRADCAHARRHGGRQRSGIAVARGLCAAAALGLLLRPRRVGGACVSTAPRAREISAQISRPRAAEHPYRRARCSATLSIVTRCVWAGLGIKGSRDQGVLRVCCSVCVCVCV